jgi:hypothetical protein
LVLPPSTVMWNFFSLVFEEHIQKLSYVVLSWIHNKCQGFSSNIIKFGQDLLCSGWGRILTGFANSQLDGD